MQKKIYFQNLDAIRFIAAMMVFFTHRMGQLFVLSGSKCVILGKLWDLIACGSLGLSMLFVLSGFLITYLLLLERELTNRINLKNFYIRRVLRIWPLYYLVLLIGFGIFPWLSHSTEIIASIPSRIMYYLPFVSNFDVIHIFKNHLLQNNDVLRMQGITWAVSVEEQFYLVWPLLLIFVKPRYFIFIFLSAILVSVAFRIYNQDDYFVLNYHTLAWTVDVAMGGLTAYLVLKYRAFKDFFSRIPPWFSLLVYISGAAVLLCREHIMYVVPYARGTIHLFYGTFFAFIILDQNFSPQSFLKFGRFKFLTNLGRLGYGIYLLHPIAMGIVDYFVLRFKIIDTDFYNYLIIGIVTLLLTLVMTYVSYEFYEKRFLKLKNKFSVITKE